MQLLSGKHLTSSLYVTDDLGDRNRQNSIMQLGQDASEVAQLSESYSETVAASLLLPYTAAPPFG